jgi:hypothetical protein
MFLASCTKKYPDELFAKVSIIGKTELTVLNFAKAAESIDVILEIFIHVPMYPTKRDFT